MVLRQSPLASAIGAAVAAATTFRSGKWKILPPAAFGGYGGVAEYDPLSRKVIGSLGQQVHAYDSEKGTSKLLLENISDKYHVSGYCGTLVYFPPDQKMYCIPADKKVWIIELDRKDLAKSKLVIPKVSGSCPPSECGFACDAKNQVIGGGVKDNRFYVFDPVNRAWNSKEIQGARPGTVTFHCLAYSPVDNVYVFIANDQTWAYRWKR